MANHCKHITIFGLVGRVSNVVHAYLCKVHAPVHRLVVERPLPLCSHSHSHSHWPVPILFMTTCQLVNRLLKEQIIVQ